MLVNLAWRQQLPFMSEQ